MRAKEKSGPEYMLGFVWSIETASSVVIKDLRILYFCVQVCCSSSVWHEGCMWKVKVRTVRYLVLSQIYTWWSDVSTSSNTKQIQQQQQSLLPQQGDKALFTGRKHGQVSGYPFSPWLPCRITSREQSNINYISESTEGNCPRGKLPEMQKNLISLTGLWLSTTNPK